MPYEAARTRLLLARTIRGPDPEIAEAGARAALAASRTSARSQISSPQPSCCVKRTGKAPDPAGLTRREMEVLRLVAQGLSDKEIATRLVLSRHTVHRHIHSILTKLDRPSRTAAAAYAVRHDLL